MNVRFAPADVGVVSADLVIRSDVADRPVTAIALLGEAVDLPFCVYSLSSRDLDFGSVRIGHTVERDLRFENLGAGDCQLHSLEILPGGSPQYWITATPAGASTLGPGESLTFTVAFTPIAVGTQLATASTYVSAEGMSNLNIQLRGTGTRGGMIVAPEGLDFGKIDTSCDGVARTVRVRNAAPSSSSPPITLVSAEILPNEDNFQITSPLPGALTNIQPHRLFEVTVRYGPNSRGRHFGLLRLREANEPEPYYVALTGEQLSGAMIEKSFTQPISPVVDLLLVIDNSATAADDQQSVADNFAALQLAAEANNADYQIAVVSMSLGMDAQFPCPLDQDRPLGISPGDCGYFADGPQGMPNPDWKLITRGELPAPEDAFRANVLLGTRGSPIEKGFESAHRALSPELLEGWNAGFLRPGARLGVVFVSDEEDQSPGSVAHYYDEFATIRGFRRLEDFSAALLSPATPGGCSGATGPGARYVDLTAGAASAHRTTCTSGWAPAMELLGNSMFGFRNSIPLDRGVDHLTLEVLVDGVVVPQTSTAGETRWSWDLQTFSIFFAPASVPAPGSEIVVRYAAGCW